MAGNTTTYKVDIEYDLKGSASAGLKGLSNNARQATQSMGGLKSMVLAVGGGLLFHAGKKALIDFNNEVQKLKIGLATVTAMNLHVPFDMAAKAADQMFDHFQKMAVESPNTTKDFVEMANMISSAVLQAGMGLKDLEQMTKGAVTASNALGARPDLMAREVQRMLAGTVIQRDRYARQMMAGIGITDYHTFNKKTAGDRAKLTMEAFNSKPIQDAAKAYATSFEGVTSTLKDNLQIAFGKVGMPLVKALTDEVSRWNDWIMKNPEKIAEFTQSIGSGLKEAFVIAKDIAVSVFPVLKEMVSVIGDVFSFLANHKDALEAAVKALLVFKGVKLASNILGGAAGGVGGLFGGLTGGVKKIGEAFEGGGVAVGALASGIGEVLVPLAAFGTGLFSLVKFMSAKTEDEKKDEAHDNAAAKVAKDSQEFAALFAERAHMEAQRTALGISSSSEFMGYSSEIRKLNDQIKATSDAIIKTGITEGLITVDKSNGRLVFGDSAAGLTGAGSGNGMSLVGMQATDDLKRSLLLLLKDAADQAAADQSLVYGRNAMMFGAHGGGVNTGAGMQYGWMAIPVEPDVQTPKSAYDLAGIKPADVKVTINKIEVYSDDPDRFVAQAVQSFEEIAQNPSMAHETMRGAF